MNKANVCACPNLNCPNHGNCKDCTSRHLKIKTLNYCGFYSIHAFFKEIIETLPNSEASLKIKQLVENQTQAYTKLIKKNSLTEEGQSILRVKKSNVSNH